MSLALKFCLPFISAQWMTYIFWALQCIVVQEHSLCHVTGFMITSMEWTHWWKFSSEDGKISIKWSWTDLLGMIQFLLYVLFLWCFPFDRQTSDVVLTFGIVVSCWCAHSSECSFAVLCTVLKVAIFLRILLFALLGIIKWHHSGWDLNVRCVSRFKNFCFRIAVRCLRSACCLKSV